MSDFPEIKELEEPLAIVPTRLEGESVLEFTNRVRLATVEQLTSHKLPDDPKDIYALNSLLDSIDRQEISKAKIEADKENTANERFTLEVISGVLNSVGNKNPYEAQQPVARTIEHDGPVIEGVSLVEGELDTRPEQLNYDQFMKEYKLKNPKPKNED